MNIKIIIVGVLVLGVVVGAYTVMRATEQEKSLAVEKMLLEQQAMTEKSLMEKKEKEASMIAPSEEVSMMSDTDKAAMDADGTMMKKDESMTNAMPEAMMDKGSYELYDASKLVRAQKGDVVLFFKASWCPTCKSLDADITANKNNIRDGLSILEVNYDDSAALKQKYGVTYQHTLVQVGSDGEMISKWSGSPTLAALTVKVQ